MDRGAIIKTLFALSVSAAVYFRVHGYLYPLFLPTVLVASFLWGDWEERMAAGALVLALEILTLGPHYGLFPHAFDVAGSRIGVFFVGAGYMSVLLFVCLRSEKWWPSWVAAFQLLLVLSHPLFAVLGEHIEPWAYASGIVIWTWLQLIAISFGVFDAWRASRRKRLRLIGSQASTSGRSSK